MNSPKIHPKFQAIYDFASCKWLDRQSYLSLQLCFWFVLAFFCFFMFLLFLELLGFCWFILLLSLLYFFLLSFFFFLFSQLSNVLCISDYILCKSGALLQKNPLKNSCVCSSSYTWEGQTIQHSVLK